MRVAERITVAYDPREDRLRLATLDNTGQAIGIWLTRRMANILVSALVDCLDRVVEAQPEVIAGSTPASKPAAQYIQQAKADLQKQPEAPVRAAIHAQAGLPIIERVRLRRVGATFVLELGWRDGGIALPGDQTWLRQFLRILYRNYHAGEWPIAGIWPEWFGDNAHRTVLGAHQIN